MVISISSPSLYQTSCGVIPSSSALVSVAVPYSSVPHTYKVLYPRRRQYLHIHKYVHGTIVPITICRMRLSEFEVYMLRTDSKPSDLFKGAGVGRRVRMLTLTRAYALRVFAARAQERMRKIASMASQGATACYPVASLLVEEIKETFQTLCYCPKRFTCPAAYPRCRCTHCSTNLSMFLLLLAILGQRDRLQIKYSLRLN